MKKFPFLFSLLLLGVTCYSQTSDNTKTNTATPVADTSVNTKPQKFITKHSITIDGKPINYTATAGTLILKDEKGEPIAVFGFTAYTKDNADGQKRPVTFAYNGGPGSSSLWLHMGALGPRRVAINDLAATTPAPYTLEDNTNSILDVTDIVMIDPVGTGLSHAIGKAKNKDFWGIDADIKSVSNFIKQYITEYDRWNSPKYLLGESYGTFRSAGVADYLQENSGIVLNGVVLISVVLDMRQLEFVTGDDISYILYLPTYAATSWYHNKIANKPADITSFIKEVENFAKGEYATALLKGSELNDAEKNEIANKLSAYTGLSKDYILKADLRVSEPQYTQELLRDEHLTVGRLDSRFKAINQRLTSEFSDFDPQSTAISPAYTTTFLNYYFNELKVSTNNDYHISAYGADGFSWEWNRRGGNRGTTMPDLADVMSKNPNLKILVLNGFYDLATPFFGTEYTMQHLGLEKNIQKNIIMKYFEAGHMMYVNPESLIKFKKDIAEFITNSSK